MIGLSPVLLALAAFCWGLSGGIGGIGGILLAAGWTPFVVSFYRGGDRAAFRSALAGVASPGQRLEASTYSSPQAILVIVFAVLVTILIRPGDFNQILAVLSSSAWPLFVALGILGAGLSFIFYIVGINYTTPAVASIVATVEPVTAALFGLLVLNESLIGLQLFGMGLILVTVTALTVSANS